MKVAACLLGLCAAALAQETYSGSEDLDRIVEEAVRSELIPGAVLLVGHEGKVLHRKAYGSRALIPAREPMTLDTIFDAASLTKVVATTSSIMKLFEEGKLRVNERVTHYLPEFQGGKSDITVRDLLTHFSGLRPDLDLKPAWSGYETGIHRALIDKPVNPPQTKFVYSDINFVLLGEIVRRVSGKPLDEFAGEKIFGPLGMNETGFRPAEKLRPRIAPTEINPLDGKPFRGVVHDDTARFMGGVAGHAGLFTTAADLSLFAQMMIGMGLGANGTRVLSPLTIRKFTSPETPADQPILRGFGWDMDSPFSSNRGELFPIGSYGHTGFTGTSLWIDPVTKTYVILLANSVHPHRGKLLTTLRGRIATVVAASVGIDTPGIQVAGYNETLTGGLRRRIERNGQTLTGLDVLASESFGPLKGKRIALFTNHTGLSRDGRRNIDLMVAGGVKIVRIFSPEHGVAGKEDQENVSDAKDPATGIPIFSLYQPKKRRPSPEMLAGLDALVFDIQDVGARFYTYSCSMIYAMEESAKARLPMYVLDRPNPVTGVHVEGPVLDNDLQGFIGCFAMPIRHGMTFGELAKMVNAERKLGLDLRVIAMKGWQRGDWLDATGLTWIDPSPNMRSLYGALLYPGVAMLEASKNYSVGRGTDAPFEQIGADWIDGSKLATFLNARQIPGVRVYPTVFTPVTSNFANMRVQGVRFVVTDRDAFDAVKLGLEIGFALGKLHPGKIDWEVNRFLIGSRMVVNYLKTGKDPKTYAGELEDAVRDFTDRRKSYLLY